jgi:quercetin dioxygenase-like cupin family protein
MRKLRVADLDGTADSVLASVAPGYRVDGGGVAALRPGERSHPEGRHVHPTPEVFVILEGRGTVEINGGPSPVVAGDVLVVEPGEDHHLIGGPERPLLTTWLHLVSVT